MRFGMQSRVRAAGAIGTAPPPSGLVQNEQGVWGYYAIPPGSELTQFYPYQPQTVPNSEFVASERFRTTGDSTPGITGTGDSTLGRSGTGDTTPGRAGTGDTTPGRIGLGDQRGFGPPSTMPTQQLIPCVGPPWASHVLGQRWGNTPGTLLPAGAAGISSEITVTNLLGWAAFALGIALGHQVINNVYAQRAT